MNRTKLKTAWYPLCRSKDLGKKPKASKLLGEPLVLVRLDKVNKADNKNNKDGQTVSCFRNVCPHRLIPLSEGNVVKGRLQCGYHGWKFDSEGQLQNVPGLPELILSEKSEVSEPDSRLGCPHQQLVQYPCYEQEGWIWVSLNQEIPTKILIPQDVPRTFQPQEGFDRLMTFRTFNADFIHAIENFLDPVHTLFIHRGLIRSVGVQHLKYRQTHNEQGFTTHYTMVNKQNGLINKLFDPGVTVNIARFQFPGLASIAYCKEDTVLFEVSLFFVPMDKGEVGMATNIHIKQDKLPAWLKFGAIRPFIEAVFYQDKKMLEKQLLAKNKMRILDDFGKPFDSKNPYQSTSADLVIDHLVYLLVGGDEGIDKIGEMMLDVD